MEWLSLTPALDYRFAIALILAGPERMLDIARSPGKSICEFKNSMNEAALEEKEIGSSGAGSTLKPWARSIRSTSLQLPFPGGVSTVNGTPFSCSSSCSLTVPVSITASS